jgi:hypothetical protein
VISENMADKNTKDSVHTLLPSLGAGYPAAICFAISSGFFMNALQNKVNQ